MQAVAACAHAHACTTPGEGLQEQHEGAYRLAKLGGAPQSERLTDPNGASVRSAVCPRDMPPLG